MPGQVRIAATPTATLPPARVATPVINPGGGEFAINQQRPVTISTTTAGAKIRYTLNGTAPSRDNGVEIPSNRGNLSVTPTTDPGTTLRAIAFTDNGMIDSEVQQAIFYYLADPPAGADRSSAALSEAFDSPPAGVGSPSASFAPTYDHNGNLISYKGFSYRYDAQNRLTWASNGAHTALFHYDGKNRQIMRSINTGGNTMVRFSVWDDWELLEEYDTSNVRQAAYLQGAQGVVKSLVNNVYYYQDKLGSTTHIADGSGNLLESYRYDLYGTPSYFDSTSQPINSSTVGVTDLYAGERWIGELGLYDLRNRFMSPELGRFLQADPVGFGGDASNLYRYCHNDPEDFSDPTGLVATNLPDFQWSHLMWEQGNSPYGFNDLYQAYVNAGASGGGGGRRETNLTFGGQWKTSPLQNDPAQPQAEQDSPDWRQAGLAGGHKAWAKTDHSGLGGTNSFEHGGLILKHWVNGRWMYNYNGVYRGKQGAAGGMRHANFLQVGKLPVPKGWVKAGWYYAHPIRGDTINQFDKDVADQYHWVVVGFAPQIKRELTGPMIEFYPKP